MLSRPRGVAIVSGCLHEPFNLPLGDRECDSGHSPWGQLLRLARDYRFRSRAPCNGRWRKDREIGIAAGEPIETDLAIANGCEFAAQETWRGTVLGGRCEGV